MIDVQARLNMLRRELDHHAESAARRDTVGAWRALERAHILAQPYLLPHLRVHAVMLGYACRTGDIREIAGQIIRLMAAPLGTITGRLPIGNTGRSNVSMFEPMPIPSDLAAIVKSQAD